MRGYKRALAMGLLLIGVVLTSPARAENCLQRFSCQLYGACRLPCLDELTGTPAQAPPPPQPAPPATRELADTPQAPAAAMPKHAPPARPKLARKETPRERLALVRVVGAPGITSLAQLAGKPVSFGPEGDASQLLGRRMFARLGLKVEETPLDFANALDGVGTGDIAAVVVLHDRDVAKLKSLSSRDLHLLSVPADAAPPAGMKTATLSAEAAGPLAHGRPLRAFAVDVTGIPQLTRRVASAR